jgi:hypothetical protein
MVIDEVLVNPATAIAAAAYVGGLLPHSVGGTFNSGAALVAVDFDDGAVVDAEAHDSLRRSPVWFGPPEDAFWRVHDFVARVCQRRSRKRQAKHSRKRGAEQNQAMAHQTDLPAEIRIARTVSGGSPSGIQALALAQMPLHA